MVGSNALALLMVSLARIAQCCELVGGTVGWRCQSHPVAVAAHVVVALVWAAAVAALLCLQKCASSNCVLGTQLCVWGIRISITLVTLLAAPAWHEARLASSFWVHCCTCICGLYVPGCSWHVVQCSSGWSSEQKNVSGLQQHHAEFVCIVVVVRSFEVHAAWFL